jgi:tetratricopeptide (TPR) repeat protein
MKFYKSKLKTIFVLFLCTVILVVAYSCRDYSLDIQPVQDTEATYFTDQDEFRQSVLGVYAKLTDIYWYAGGSWKHDMWHLPGDAITSAGDYDFETFAPIQPGATSSYWDAAYQLINRANTLLGKIEAAEEGVYNNPELKDYHKGETLFLRGFIYFQVWNFFGSHAPLVIERIESSENISPPSSNSERGLDAQWSTEILDQVISDLDQARQLLPTSWADDDRGRVTQNSANGMLGKALVFRASVTGQNSDYSDAIAAFDRISGVSLTDNYADNFNVNTENNVESLFEFQASESATDNVWLSNDFNQAVGSMSAYWGFYEGHFSMFGQESFVPTSKLVGSYNPDDPRIDEVLGPITEPLASRNQIIKYNKNGAKTGTGVGSLNNPRILRYADVLLLKAEAILESGGSTSEAISLINQVRERARNSATPASAEPADYSTNVTDNNQIFQWIMNERFIELAGEDTHRWFDLRRWHRAGKIDLSTFDFSSVRSTFGFDVNKHLFFPIPNSELDNNVNVVQNEGY